MTCSGTARDNLALLKSLTHLRATKEIGDLKVGSNPGQISAAIHFQFSLGRKGGCTMIISNRQKLLSILAITAIAIWVGDKMVLTPLTNLWKTELRASQS